MQSDHSILTGSWRLLYKFLIFRPEDFEWSERGGGIGSLGDGSFKATENFLNLTVPDSGAQSSTLVLRAFGPEFAHPRLASEDYEGGMSELIMNWRGSLSFAGEHGAEKEAALQAILFPPPPVDEGAAAGRRDDSPSNAPRLGPCWLCDEPSCRMTAKPSKNARLGDGVLEDLTSHWLQNWLCTQKVLPTRERDGKTELGGYGMNPTNWRPQPEPTSAQVCRRGHLVVRRAYLIYSYGTDDD